MIRIDWPCFAPYGMTVCKLWLVAGLTVRKLGLEARPHDRPPSDALAYELQLPHEVLCLLDESVHHDLVVRT